MWRQRPGLDRAVWQFPAGVRNGSWSFRLGSPRMTRSDACSQSSTRSRWRTCSHAGCEASRRPLRRASSRSMARPFGDCIRQGEWWHVRTMVSAWSTANGVVLGQVGTAEGSNEIEAFPRLLDLLHVDGCLVTIDAAGCRPAWRPRSRYKGGDYLLAVRDNQPKLYEATVQAFDELRTTKRSPGRGRRATSRKPDAGGRRSERARC